MPHKAIKEDLVKKGYKTLLRIIFVFVFAMVFFFFLGQVQAVATVTVIQPNGGESVLPDSTAYDLNWSCVPDDASLRISDDFSDGDYTNNPAWDVNTGTSWTAGDYNLAYTAADNTKKIDLNIGAGFDTVHLKFKSRFHDTGARINAYILNDAYAGYGFQEQHDGNWTIQEAAAGFALSTLETNTRGKISGTDWHDFEMIVNATSFILYVDGNVITTIKNITTRNFTRIRFANTDLSQAYFDDVEIDTNNTGYTLVYLSNDGTTKNYWVSDALDIEYNGSDCSNKNVDLNLSNILAVNLADDNLVGHWPLNTFINGNCAINVKDGDCDEMLAFSANDIIDQVAVTPGTGVPHIEGDKTYNFDNLGNNAISIGHNDINSGVGVCAWIYYENAGGTFFGRNNWYLLDPNSDDLRMYFWNGSVSCTTSGNAMTTNTWYHACGTYDVANDTVKIWQDKVEKNSCTNNNGWPAGSGEPDVIAARTPAAGNNWNGRLSHVTFWNRPITSEDVNDHYSMAYMDLNHMADQQFKLIVDRNSMEGDATASDASDQNFCVGSGTCGGGGSNPYDLNFRVYELGTTIDLNVQMDFNDNSRDINGLSPFDLNFTAGNYDLNITANTTGFDNNFNNLVVADSNKTLTYYLKRIDYNVSFNIYEQGFASHLIGINIDCNLDAADANNQTSPYSYYPFAHGDHNCVFSKNNFDSNYFVWAVDANKTLTVYLTKTSEYLFLPQGDNNFSILIGLLALFGVCAFVFVKSSSIT